MARRKKKTTHHRRHRRMSGISLHKRDLQDAAMKFAGLLVGANAGTVLQRMAVRVPPKALSLIQFAGGYILTKQKNAFLVGAGYGIASAGAINFSHEMGWIHGIEDQLSGFMNGAESESIYLPAGNMNGDDMNGWGGKAALSGEDYSVNGWGAKAALSGEDDKDAARLYPGGQGW